jgi:hypothetical protein
MAVGGVLRLRLEAKRLKAQRWKLKDRKGITSFSPHSTNQPINQSTRADIIKISV